MALKTNPKMRFNATESNRVDMEKLTNQQWYQEAVAASLAHYIKETSVITGDNQADVANYHAIRGAREFAEKLLTFSDKFVPRTGNSKLGALNHDT